VGDLDKSYHPTCPPIPIVGSIHNRLNIEVSRDAAMAAGSARGVGYRPYRERSFGNVAAIIDEAIKKRVMRRFPSFPQFGDFSGLFQTISYIKEYHKGVSVALPSLKNREHRRRGNPHHRRYRPYRSHFCPRIRLS